MIPSKRLSTTIGDSKIAGISNPKRLQDLKGSSSLKFFATSSRGFWSIGSMKPFPAVINSFCCAESSRPLTLRSSTSLEQRIKCGLGQQGQPRFPARDRGGGPGLLIEERHFPEVISSGENGKCFRGRAGDAGFLFDTHGALKDKEHAVAGVALGANHF